MCVHVYKTNINTDRRDIPEDVLDSFIVSMKFVYRELIVLETMQRQATYCNC